MERRDGWTEYEKLVLAELERLNNELHRVRSDVTEIERRLHAKTADVQDSFDKRCAEVQVQIAQLQVKAGWWGALGALVAVGISLAVGTLAR